MSLVSALSMTPLYREAVYCATAWNENRDLRADTLCSTLRIYRHGEFTDYPGPRKADSIIGYMVK